MVAADSSMAISAVSAPLVVVLATSATRLLSLELSHSAEARADGHADGCSVSPAVDDSVCASRDLSTEAEVVSTVEPIVRLAADLVGATPEVVGGGAPVASVEGAELVTRKRRAASGVADGQAIVCNRWVDIGAAADGFMGGVRCAASVARTRVLVSRALASVNTAVLAVVVAADSSHVATVTGFCSPYPLVVVLATGSASLLSLKLGNRAETRPNANADGCSMIPSLSRSVGTTCN